MGNKLPLGRRGVTLSCRQCLAIAGVTRTTSASGELGTPVSRPPFLAHPMSLRFSSNCGLRDFLRDQCEATKAKYAAELANADAEEWKPALDMWYADSLVDYFGLLERRIEQLYSGPHMAGCRVWFRKAPECSPTLYKSPSMQTELALEALPEI